MSASTRTTATQLLDNERFWRIFVWTVLLAGAVVMFLPFLWLLSSSLKTELAIFRYPPEWIPVPIKFSNYVDAWTTRPFALYVRNTIVILLLNEVAVLVSASFCAYGFARIDFPGRNVWFAILLATVMLPGIVTMIPQFVIFSRIGWVNTILPLTVPFFFGGGAFNIFLLRQFFRTLPAELADAAYIDGASEITIYWRIMLPLAKPALATIAIFTFIGTWNDFMGPLLYLAKDPNKFTVALGLAMFRTAFAGRTRWDLLMAASTMMIIPVIFVFFVAQRYFIQGIAISGLKG
ncbi:MAG: carbohydrate ABC transporter permease [Caldilineaceae bacterium]|nr:carbohydrate ABC transporter permease [Caldilineaceae bacterium]MCY3993038.1 carbohydrate ABC transporter permease [Caldilineaceae bacterium]